MLRPRVRVLDRTENHSSSLCQNAPRCTRLSTLILFMNGGSGSLARKSIWTPSRPLATLLRFLGIVLTSCHSAAALAPLRRLSKLFRSAVSKQCSVSDQLRQAFYKICINNVHVAERKGFGAMRALRLRARRASALRRRPHTCMSGVSSYTAGDSCVSTCGLYDMDCLCTPRREAVPLCGWPARHRSPGPHSGPSSPLWQLLV